MNPIASAEAQKKFHLPKMTVWIKLISMEYPIFVSMQKHTHNKRMQSGKVPCACALPLNRALCKLQETEPYSNYLEGKLILRYFTVLLFFSFQNAMGGETFIRDNSLKSQLIQLAYTTAILTCEDPSREYYKGLLKSLIDAGKKYNELTDSEISALRGKTAKFTIECHRDVIEGNSYRDGMLIKIYCYESYLNRFDNVEIFMTRVKFFDESGNSSEYIRDITKEIELDANYNLKAAECFKGIEKLHKEQVHKYNEFITQ